MKCNFCGTPLPEPGATHAILATGSLHKMDPTMEPWGVCSACLRFHRLKMVGLLSKRTIEERERSINPRWT